MSSLWGGVNTAYVDDAHREIRREVFMNVIRLYCEMVLAPAHTLSMQIAYSENSLTRYSRHERTPRVSEEKKTRPLREKEEGSLGAGGSNMAVEGNIRPYFPN